MNINKLYKELTESDRIENPELILNKKGFPVITGFYYDGKGQKWLGEYIFNGKKWVSQGYIG